MKATWEGGEPVIKHDGHLPIVGKLEQVVANWPLVRKLYGFHHHDWSVVEKIAMSHDVEQAVANYKAGPAPVQAYDLTSEASYFQAFEPHFVMWGNLQMLSEKLEMAQEFFKKSMDKLVVSTPTPQVVIEPSNSMLVMERLAAKIPGMYEVVKLPCDCGFDDPVYKNVIHLNDAHHWTREAVADWLDTLDVDLSVQEHPVYGRTGVVKWAATGDALGPVLYVLLAVEGKDQALELTIPYTHEDDAQTLSRFAVVLVDNFIEPVYQEALDGVDHVAMYGRRVGINLTDFTPGSITSFGGMLRQAFPRRPRSLPAAEEELMEKILAAGADEAVDMISTGFKDIGYISEDGPGDVPAQVIYSFTGAAAKVIGQTHCPVGPEWTKAAIDNLKKAVEAPTPVMEFYNKAW